MASAEASLQPIAAGKRRQVLRALLPDVDVAGAQAAYQLAETDVGDAYATIAGGTAVVVVGTSAWLYGVPTSEVGDLLTARAFVGLLAGAEPALDPRPAVPGVPAERHRRRLVFEGDGVAGSLGVPAPLTHRGFTAADEETLRRSAGGWVLELWEQRWSAPFAQGVFASNGDLVAVGGAYALTERYAEIAAWADPIAARMGLIFAGSQSLLAPMVTGGRRLSAVILDTNTPALHWAQSAGWHVVAEQLVVTLGRRRPGLPRPR